MGMTGNVAMVFHTKILLPSPFICYSMMENHLQKSKRPQSH